jgi:hypothetical protein
MKKTKRLDFKDKREMVEERKCTYVVRSFLRGPFEELLD